MSPFIKQIVSNYWPLALKLASLAITGILGVIGLLNDFKDKSGRLNKWGRISLCGLVLASLVGLATEIVDGISQKEEEKRHEEAAFQQLEEAKQTNSAVKKVLDGNQTIQSEANATLAEQSKLFGSSQVTLHEVERGLTPLGDIGAEYEFMVPVGDRKFGMFRQLIDDAIKEFEAGNWDSVPYRQKFNFRREIRGVTIFANLTGDRAQWVTAAGLDPDSEVIQKASVEDSMWATILFGHTPFGVSLWRKQPGLLSCMPSAPPDLVLKPVNADFTLAPGHRSSAPDMDNSYLWKEQEVVQSGHVSLRRSQDNGVFSSSLDLEGATIGIIPTIDPVSITPDGFAFRRFNLRTGHFLATLDLRHPVQRCGTSLYYRLPAQLQIVQ